MGCQDFFSKIRKFFYQGGYVVWNMAINRDFWGFLQHFPLMVTVL
jgi:hypothetical protein